MEKLVKELKEIMEERSFSCETAAKFIGCSGRQVDRWLREEAKPTLVYLRLIKKGIKRMKNL